MCKVKQQMKFWNFALMGMMLILSSGANASVINTLNGVDYEWLEFSETQGLNRYQVEGMLSAANPGDNLYGYQYASRTQVEELLISYMPWGGGNGYFADATLISGFQDMMGDFGYTSQGGYSTNFYTSDTNIETYVETRRSVFGIYGTNEECIFDERFTCVSGVDMWYDSNGNPALVTQGITRGFDSSLVNPDVINISFGASTLGSYLVRPAVSTVPIPAAVWLFSSGLIGLMGFARRKKA